MADTNKKVINNASWIIVTKVAESILALIISTLTVRYLGPSNYGLISYASSLVAFILPVMQLGLPSILVQEFVDNPEDEGQILGTSLFLSFLSAIASMLGIFAFVSIVNKDENTTIVVCVLYSLLLLTQALALTQYWFQSKLASKYVSVTSFVAYSLVLMYKTYLLVTEKSVSWFALSNVFDYAIIAAVLLVLYKKKSGAKLKISLITARRMLKKSRYYIISNMMITLFTQTDRIMLKLMNGNSVAGYYSAAATCCLITNFIFTAILDSMRPVIFESRKISPEKFEKNVSRLYCIIIYLALMQSIFITVLSPFIVNILYGSAYGTSSDILRVFIWYTVFSYIGAVRNIWMLAEDKQKYLWIINLSGAVINVVLNLIFIPILSGMGAAIASLVTQIFINVIIGYIMRPISYNNKLMLKGLNPLLFVEILKTVIGARKKSDAGA